LGKSGSTRSHNPSDTSHGFVRIDTPPQLENGCRRTRPRRTGPSIQLELLSLLYLVGVVQRRQFANRDDVVGLETDVAVLTAACERLLAIVESDPLIDYL
jgi:hypothetical protein